MAQAVKAPRDSRATPRDDAHAGARAGSHGAADVASSEALAAASAPSVRELTTAIRRGCADSFGRFYDGWFDRAHALVRSWLRRDESFCLDVVQDAMLRAVRALPPLADEDALAAWMARTLRSVAVDRLRAEARRARRERDAHAAALQRESTTDPASLLQQHERGRWLDARLAELSDAERALLAQRFGGDGKTLDAAGAALGLSGDAVHGRIRRLVARLRRAADEAFR